MNQLDRETLFVSSLVADIARDEHLIAIFRHQANTAKKDYGKAMAMVDRTGFDIKYKGEFLHNLLFELMLSTSHRKYVKLLKRVGLWDQEN